MAVLMGRVWRVGNLKPTWLAGAATGAWMAQGEGAGRQEVGYCWVKLGVLLGYDVKRVLLNTADTAITADTADTSGTAELGAACGVACQAAS